MKIKPEYREGAIKRITRSLLVKHVTSEDKESTLLDEISSRRLHCLVNTVKHVTFTQFVVD
jgi:hypothetical protein